MTRREAAGAGTALAGIALATTLLPWPDAGTLTADAAVAGGRVSVTPAATALALIALGGFLARRHGYADRPEGSAAAGVASVAVAVYGLAAVVGAARAGEAIGQGPSLAVLAGAGAGLAALTDGLAIPRDRALRMIQAALGAAGVGLVGLLAIDVWALSLATLVESAFGLELSAMQRTVVSTVGLGFGTVTVAVGYLIASDRDRSFVDLRAPTARDAVYGVGGLVGLLVVLYGGTYLLELLEISSSDHGIIEQAEEGDHRILLVLIPASFLIVGPGEELLFRNVVQKSLYDVFSRPGAVVVASVIFAAVHFSAYATAGVLSILGSLALVFLLSLVLGGVYARTDNLLVPALIHGAYNALSFAAVYVEITRGVGALGIGI